MSPGYSPSAGGIITAGTGVVGEGPDGCGSGLTHGLGFDGFGFAGLGVGFGIRLSLIVASTEMFELAR